MRLERSLRQAIEDELMRFSDAEIEKQAEKLKQDFILRAKETCRQATVEISKRMDIRYGGDYVTFTIYDKTG